jgi:hypothetical protein
MVFYLQKMTRGEPPVALGSHVEVFYWLEEVI